MCGTGAEKAPPVVADGTECGHQAERSSESFYPTSIDRPLRLEDAFVRYFGQQISSLRRSLPGSRLICPITADSPDIWDIPLKPRTRLSNFVTSVALAPNLSVPKPETLSLRDCRIACRCPDAV